MAHYSRKITKRILSYWRIFWLEIGYHLYGIEYVNEKLLQTTIGAAHILKHFGATVGSQCVVHGPLIVHNAQKDYTNLIIGERVHIGRSVLLDLTDMIKIGDEAVISMNCTLLTHQDVGDRPQKLRYPREVQPLVIGSGAYIGAGSTILAGASVGRLTVVAAGALVNRAISENTLVGGVPASVLKTRRSKPIEPPN